MTRECRNCHHCDLKPDTDSARQMKKHGYARCFLLSKSQYVAGWHVCPKWKAKS